MEERTRAYLRGRFGDHYGRTSVSPPPQPNEREWGHIPWTSTSGTTMVRHRSWLDVGDLEAFLERERPRHVYFSAGTYDDPGAGSMSRKGWRGADLVFDLDADHLPGVDPEETTYGDMLRECKGELLDLLDLLEDDFGFEDVTVVFSGGRGYHVHVRDDGVRDLDRSDRREIVEYVLAEDLDLEDLLQRELVPGMGLENPTQKRTLSTTAAGGSACTTTSSRSSTRSANSRRRTRWSACSRSRASATARRRNSSTSSTSRTTRSGAGTSRCTGDSSRSPAASPSERSARNPHRSTNP